MREILANQLQNGYKVYLGGRGLRIRNLTVTDKAVIFHVRDFSGRDVPIFRNPTEKVRIYL